jgi:two-component system chemotaxis response regulator CheB
LPTQPKIRVLVVDDSVVVRKVLSETLSSDSDLEVAGCAPDGRIALAKIPQCRPDLITLDVAMPVMDGIETLSEIRKLYPKLPVIMFSVLTGTGAAVTLNALALGASDYVAKPGNTGSPESAVERIRVDLIPKIKALCAPPSKTAVAPRPRARNRRTSPIEIVAIGASTGGPNALAALFPSIPKDFPVPIVTVQHMPPIFTRLLAERLASRSQISVEEGREGANLMPGHAWIAPGNFHMTVKRTTAGVYLELDQEPPEHSCRPAVDVLFRSVAAAYGANALGVVMTGMGSDGVIGSRQIRAAGGEILVQDEASSVVWGMPGLTYAAGQADAVYPLDRLGPEIARRVLESHATRAASEFTAYAAPEPTAR